MVIGIGSQKGGSGKTSLTIGLANYLKYSNINPALKFIALDLDPQMSLSKIREDDVEFLEEKVREGEIASELKDAIIKNMYPIHYVPVSKIFDKINVYTDEYDVVLIDLPGTIDQVGVLEAYALLDIMFLPTNVTKQDIFGTIEFLVKYSEKTLVYRKKLDLPLTAIYGVLTKVDKNLSAFRDRKELLESEGKLEEFPIEFIKEVITNSQAVFGTHINTFDILRNSKGEPAFTTVFETLAKKIKL